MLQRILRADRFIDLSRRAAGGHTLAFSREGMAHEYWPDDLRLTDGRRLSVLRTSSGCASIATRGTLQGPALLLPGSVLLPDLGPTHLPGESAGQLGPRLAHRGAI
jgi:hypothetical protein